MCACMQADGRACKQVGRGGGWQRTEEALCHSGVLGLNIVALDYDDGATLDQSTCRSGNDTC